MMTMSALEVLGPIMVGPSSSHTAGALRIALAARSLAPDPLVRVEFWLYNSFSHTPRTWYRSGPRCRYARLRSRRQASTRFLCPAKEHGLTFNVIEKGDDESLHPNTVEVHMYGLTPHTWPSWESLLAEAAFASAALTALMSVWPATCPPSFVSPRHAWRSCGLHGGSCPAAYQCCNHAHLPCRARGVAYTIFEIDEEISKRTLTLFRQAPTLSTQLKSISRRCPCDYARSAQHSL